jgi:hypothetical protein
MIARTDWPGFASAVAYRTENELRVADGIEGLRVGLWSPVQLPAGGTVHIACNQAPAYRDYFDPAPADHLEHSERSLRLRISGARQFKVGVSSYIVASSHNHGGRTPMFPSAISPGRETPSRCTTTTAPSAGSASSSTTRLRSCQAAVRTSSRTPTRRLRAGRRGRLAGMVPALAWLNSSTTGAPAGWLTRFARSVQCGRVASWHLCRAPDALFIFTGQPNPPGYREYSTREHALTANGL